MTLTCLGYAISPENWRHCQATHVQTINDGNDRILCERVRANATQTFRQNNQADQDEFGWEIGETKAHLESRRRRTIRSIYSSKLQGA